MGWTSGDTPYRENMTDPNDHQHYTADDYPSRLYFHDPVTCGAVKIVKPSAFSVQQTNFNRAAKSVNEEIPVK